MRINHSSYSEYIDSLQAKLCNESFYTPILLNNETMLFPLMEKKDLSLVISMNQKTPLVYLIDNDSFFASFEKSFAQRFRKEIGKFVLRDIYLDKNDFIVTMNIESIEDFGKSFILKVELIPAKPNILLLDENELIIDFYSHSKTRELIRGQKYPALENQLLLEGGEIFTNELINEHFENEFRIRLSEKFSDFKKYISSKIKAAERKIKNIQNDVSIAEESLKFEEYANYIYTYHSNKLKDHLSELEIDGHIIKLDSVKTVRENAESFYKKAKKAKEAIARSEINIQNAIKERDDFTAILEEFLISNEKKADELVALYGQNNKKKEVKETIFNRPWKINYNGTIIYFGRNASQNDYLSFVMKLDREFTWLHIKDKSGAHLVIANKKPTDNELLLACEVSLLCSRATSGEIVYTKKKNVRRGHVLGEALLKNHSTIKLNRIREKAIEIFAKAKRCD